MLLHLGNNTLGKTWVAGKDDWGEYRSGGTRGSHPGINVPDLSPRVRRISPSPGELSGPGGGAPPGGEYRSGGTGGSHLRIGNFSGPVSSGLEPHRGVKCS